MENIEEEGQGERESKRFLFGKNIVVTFGGGLKAGGGEIHLRRPTARELNAFDKQSTPVTRKGIQIEKINTVGARVTLFDAIFVKALNFEDETGPIPEGGKDRLPEDVKNYVVLNHVQAQENIDIKN